MGKVRVWMSRAKHLRRKLREGQQWSESQVQALRCIVVGVIERIDTQRRCIVSHWSAGQYHMPRIQPPILVAQARLTSPRSALFAASSWRGTEACTSSTNLLPTSSTYTTTEQVTLKKPTKHFSVSPHSFNYHKHHNHVRQAPDARYAPPLTHQS